MYVMIGDVPQQTDPKYTWVKKGLYAKVRDFGPRRVMIRVNNKLTIVNKLYILEENE